MENKIWNELSEESKKYVKHIFSGFEPRLHEDSMQMHLMNELFGEENLKPKPQIKIKTWADCEKNFPVRLETCFAMSGCKVVLNGFMANYNIQEKIIKKAIATIKIAELIEHCYGGMITDEEWQNKDMPKYAIQGYADKLNTLEYNTVYDYKQFIAFHTEEQRDVFFEYNEQLCKDYYMI